MALIPLLAAANAVARARRYLVFPTGQCLRWVSTVLTGGRMLGYYGKSSGYALDAWRQAKYKHRGDRKPPAGVPVFWNHGYSNTYGHVAISLGGGRIRSTDWPFKGQVGETTIDELSRRWGREYLGWSEDLCGVRIPGFPRAAPRRLVKFPGTQRRGSQGHPVEQIQKAINGRIRSGQLKGVALLKVDESYGAKTEAAVRAVQKAERIRVDGMTGPVTWGRLKIYNR